MTLSVSFSFAAQGRLHNKRAQEADERASQDIFTARCFPYSSVEKFSFKNLLFQILFN